VLEQNGIDVLMTRVPATSSIKERASMLEKAIAEKYGGRQINLVGHSMVSQSSPLHHPASC
jgi:triacylglycerol lipase